jgi:putative ABC transport system ATP-binding protein
MPEPLISMQKVKKVFVTDEVETHALEEIDLEIQRGEYVSISGPSGCGKSTLLAILGLLDSPSSGTYLLNNQPVASLKLSERARVRNREIGFIFQAFNLIGDLTVYENVELPLTYRGMGSSERKRRTTEALDRVGMPHRMKHYPAQLSGGQQQRVAVARALAGDPTNPLAISTPPMAKWSWICSAICIVPAPRFAWSLTMPATRAMRTDQSTCSTVGYKAAENRYEATGPVVRSSPNSGHGHRSMLREKA